MPTRAAAWDHSLLPHATARTVPQGSALLGLKQRNNSDAPPDEDGAGGAGEGAGGSNADGGGSASPRGVGLPAEPVVNPLTPGREPRSLGSPGGGADSGGRSGLAVTPAVGAAGAVVDTPSPRSVPTPTVTVTPAATGELAVSTERAVL